MLLQGLLFRGNEDATPDEVDLFIEATENLRQVDVLHLIQQQFGMRKIAWTSGLESELKSYLGKHWKALRDGANPPKFSYHYPASAAPQPTPVSGTPPRPPPRGATAADAGVPPRPPPVAPPPAAPPPVQPQDSTRQRSPSSPPEPAASPPSDYVPGSIGKKRRE